MELDNSELKLHPHVYKLREEFTLNIRKIPEKFQQWFCLKEQKRLEFIKANNMYPNTTFSYVEVPKPFEEESNLLKKLRFMEIENDGIHNKSKIKEKEKDKKENELRLFENLNPIQMELKAARKTGIAMGLLNMKQNEKTTINKTVFQKKNETQNKEKHSKLELEDKFRRKKEFEKMANSPLLKKKLKK